MSIFAPRLRNDANMVTVVQLVRASDCGSECRGFESHQSPKEILISQALMRIFSLYKSIVLLLNFEINPS